MVGTYESFGARPFYERHGFKVVSSDRDSPRGQVGYWFHKRLALNRAPSVAPGDSSDMSTIVL